MDIEYCAVCGKPKKHIVDVPGMEPHTVPCRCDCDASFEALKQEQRRVRDAIASRRQQQRKTFTGSMVGKQFYAQTFAAFEETQDNSTALMIGRRYVRNFNPESLQGLLITGGVGSGKTFLASCVGNALLEKGYSLHATTAPATLSRMNGWEERLQAMLDADLLLLDDLGAERQTDFTYERLFMIVDGRYRDGKPMIITSNVDIVEMTRSKDMNKRRIYDRVFERCLPLTIPGNHRLKYAQQNFETVKKWIKEEQK